MGNPVPHGSPGPQAPPAALWLLPRKPTGDVAARSSHDDTRLTPFLSRRFTRRPWLHSVLTSKCEARPQPMAEACVQAVPDGT